MAPTKTCPKCQASMAQGFVIDETRYERGVSSWLEGLPERGMFTNSVKLKGRTPIEIATWRCASCGFLESYAILPSA